MNTAARLCVAVGCTLLSLALARPANAQNTFGFVLESGSGSGATPTGTLTLNYGSYTVGSVPSTTTDIFGLVTNNSTTDTLTIDMVGIASSSGDSLVPYFDDNGLMLTGFMLKPGETSEVDLGTLRVSDYLNAQGSPSPYTGTLDLTLTVTSSGTAFTPDTITPGPPSVTVNALLTPSTAVPEPRFVQLGSLCLVGGLVGAGSLRRRRQNVA